MKDETHRRMAGDYEIIQAIHIGDREIVLGEKIQDESVEKYMCAFCQQNELFAASWNRPAAPAILSVCFRLIWQAAIPLLSKNAIWIWR